jgi:phage head maturation protease
MHLTGQILKRDEEERLVYGWAYVSTVNGELVEDHSGEVIRPDTLTKAATNFMLDVRAGHFMHMGEQIGVVVHSLPITDEIAKSLGIQTDRQGWIVAIKIFSDEVWELVKSGKLPAFSIGGRAKRQRV